ncbi:hypothetical protein [Klebsiella michiganensis]|uniref:hypothetical protein n=1 Tax=Klebsiella michiganensis TaxID=1134687 RepID=UPI0027CA283C|nr:hypothetical protein [Klebsiella michiganensis]ELB7342850.1 hypothetical protein [Klebsiella michiganensis]ELC2231932.1 hypothetical protein [Klebsiella michiganensis]ELJ6253896.1 hypothetical protein [Klebsiella michiganensis]MDQ2144240.1 hypothetical protein [Klebsiella michiganensis]MDV6972220.1 hypothetical protein [Klebsiella michiganensis]
MPADWELDDERDSIAEENRWDDAQIAAKLVILGYERCAAVEKVKDVNENREYYRNDPGVHIEGDEYQASEWTVDECNYPKEIAGTFDPRQVHKIAQELIDDL